jgi:hypothetical protein
VRRRVAPTLRGRDVAWSGRRERAAALKLLVVIEISRRRLRACRSVWSARARRIDGRGLLSCVADAEGQHDLGAAPEQRQESDPEQDQVGPLGEGVYPVGPRYPTAGGGVCLSAATAASRSSGPLQPEWCRGWHEEGPAEDDHFDLVAAGPRRLARPVDAAGVPGDADAILTDEDAEPRHRGADRRCDFHRAAEGATAALAMEGSAGAGPSSLAQLVILAVIPPVRTRPKQTGLNRIAAQPDLARPN